MMTGISLNPHMALAEENESVVSSPFESPANTESIENTNIPDTVETSESDNQKLNIEQNDTENSSNTNDTNSENKNINNTDSSNDSNANDSSDENAAQINTEDVDVNNKNNDNTSESDNIDINSNSNIDNLNNEVPPSTDTNSNSDSEEPNIVTLMKKYEGKTIVDIEFEGASDFTLPTVKVVMNQHVGDTFTVDAAARDFETIMNTGYFYDLYPNITVVPEGIILTVHMLENPILKEIVFVGNTVIKTKDLQRLMTVRRGDVLNSVTLHDNIKALQEKYRGEGYVLMKIVDMNMGTDGTLTLKINEGTLEGYKLKGNKKTRDNVILRELRQKPGEVFNANLARRSMQRINNLGFFEDVNLKMLPGVEPNAIVMEIEVKEKRTGTFGIGAGYSSEDGIIGMVSIADTNFRGTGDGISLTYEVSGDDEDAHGITFTYRRPWLDSRETAGTFRFYNRTYEYDDYDTRGHLKEEYMRKYVGGEITLGRPISEYSTNYITLRNRKDEYVKHVSSGNVGDRSGENGKEWRKDNFGTTRSVTLEHVTDTRDNIYNPMTGGRVNLSAEFGGFIGGDFDFQKFSIDHQQFFKAGHAQVWAIRTKGGIGYGDISEFNQYRVGGQDTLRGYRDAQFRGDRMLLGTLEYRFPLFSKVQGALFTDWGSAWNTGFEPDEFHGSVGVGISLTTPLGPLRLDYGRGSQGGRVHFSVGGAF